MPRVASRGLRAQAVIDYPKLPGACKASGPFNTRVRSRACGLAATGDSERGQTPRRTFIEASPNLSAEKDKNGHDKPLLGIWKLCMIVDTSKRHQRSSPIIAAWPGMAIDG